MAGIEEDMNPALYQPWGDMMCRRDNRVAAGDVRQKWWWVRGDLVKLKVRRPVKLKVRRANVAAGDMRRGGGGRGCLTGG